MEALITGIGWVTGAGIGWGRQGGDCRFPNLPPPVLARPDVFPKPNQRFGRMSQYAQLGIAAIAFALRDAGLEQWQVKRPIGVVAASRLGCLASDLDYHKNVLLDGGELASPNLFAYTLANCFLGDAAIQFGLTGSSLAINETRGGLDAVDLALGELALGEADAMLAGICDLPAPAPFGAGAPPAPGAVFLVLSRRPAVDGGSYGSLAVADDNVLLDGSAVDSIIGLVQGALKNFVIDPRGYSPFEEVAATGDGKQ